MDCYIYERAFQYGGEFVTKEDFDDVVNRNNQRLYLIALSFTHNRYDAEDILQNTFLKLWKYNLFL